MRTVYDADLLLVDDNPDLLRLLSDSSPARATAISEPPQTAPPRRPPLPAKRRN